MKLLDTKGTADSLRRGILVTILGGAIGIVLLIVLAGAGRSARGQTADQLIDVDRVPAGIVIDGARNSRTAVPGPQTEPVSVQSTPQPSTITQEAIEREVNRIQVEDDLARRMMLEALRAPLGESVQVQYSESQVGVAPRGDLQVAVPPVSPDVSPPEPSRRGLFQLHEGSIIPITITRSFNTELSGTVHGMVRRSVLDSDGRGIVILPAGSELIGTYGDGAALNQDRVLVLWNKVRLPDGTFVELDASNGVDLAGQSGIEGERERGLWRTLGTTFALNLATGPGLRGLFGNGDSEIADAIREAGQAPVRALQTRICNARST